MVRHSRKRSKRYRKQRGGAVFSAEQLTELGNLGFSDEEKKEFAGLLETQAANEPNLPASVISLARIYLRQINPQTGRNRTPREFIDDEIELQNETFGGGRRRRKYRKSRKMVGGDFTEAEKVTLGNKGFTQEHIAILSNTGIGLNIIEMSLNQINPNTGAKFTPQELIDSIAEANEEMENIDEGAAVPNQENGMDNMDNMDHMDNMDNMAGVNNFEEQGPALNMEDLESDSPRSVTEMGGKKTKRRRRTKKGKTAKKRRTMNRKGRKQRGGNCYGNGVGANAYDPNYSIYNTNQLQMFPYKPN